jgi:hypothetical protein
MHPRIAAAVADVEASFAGHTVAAEELADGSVWVTVRDVDFGAGWSPRHGDFAVKLAPTFPDTGPYPWYLPPGIRREDGVAVERISPVQLDGVDRSQLSVNGPWTAADSLGARCHGVLHWLRQLVRKQAS